MSTFRVAVVSLAVFLLAACLASSQAQTYTVLHSFNGTPDGGSPFASLTRDGTGNLFGTAAYYGDPICQCGTVFEFDASGNFSVLHKFIGPPDGYDPYGSLLVGPSGSLYGTTTAGGKVVGNYSNGAGTVFEIDSSGKENILYSFTGVEADGTGPASSVIRDSAGNIYGTASGGGYSSGIVFRLNANGTETVLHTFNSFGDGTDPNSGLLRDKVGDLYGVTLRGGTENLGTIYKLNKSGAELKLISFNETGGAYPEAGLVPDSTGNFYGTTDAGGDLTCNPYGCGTIFKVTSSGTKPIHVFAGGALDGANPASAPLILDSQGNLYGTTGGGGASNLGTVFELSASGTLTILHSFSGSDGQYPIGGLVEDAVGNLYGTTAQGGAFGYGVIFKITP